MAAKKQASKAMITVQQYASPIRRQGRQKLYLKSLGLGKMNAVRQLQDNEIVRSLLAKVPHMVRIVSESVDER